MIGEATAPLRDNAELPVIVSYLSGDFVTAFLIGAAFTWLVHSSVASALLIVTLGGAGRDAHRAWRVADPWRQSGRHAGGHGALRAAAPPRPRRIAYGQLLFRGLGAVAVLLVYHLLDPNLSWLGGDVARQVINLHLAFNAVVLLVGLPLDRPGGGADGKANQAEADGRGNGQSAGRGHQRRLDQNVVSQPDLGAGQRERANCCAWPKSSSVCWRR